MKIDVFVSYHTESSLNTVKAIVNKLESNHVRCWYAPRDIEAGAYANSILQAIKACSVYLLILNKPASESVHVLNEMNAATSRLAHKEQISILPFHVDDNRQDISVDAQYYIGRMHWIDGMTPPLEQRINELTERIMLILGRKTVVDAPEQAKQYRIIQKMPQIRGIFYGREFLIGEISNSFREGNRVIYLEGMGGIGKSELAKQYAVRYNKEYDVVVFVSYTGSIKSLVCDPGAIEIIDLMRYPNEDEDTFFRRKMGTFRSLSNDRTLVILDNYDVDYDPDFDAFLEGDFRVIVTSRNAHDGNKTIRVDAIDDKMTLFRIFEENYGSNLEEDDKTALLSLFELVEYHTYTIELLAKQMAASDLSGQEILAIFRDGQLKESFSETIAGRKGRKTAFDHIRAIFSTSNLSEKEQQILRVLSLTGIQGIPKKRLKEWASLDSYETVNSLIERSWIRRESNRKVSLHPLVIEVIHADLKPDLHNCRDFIVKMGLFTVGAWKRPVLENVEVRDAVLSAIDYLAPFDVTLWYSFEAMIGYLWQVAKFDESIRYMISLYNSSVEFYGKASMVTGYIAKAVGGCYFNARRLKESIPWYKTALQCMLNSSNEDNEGLSVDIAMAYEKVGRCYTWDYERDLEKAEEYLSKSLDIRIKIRDSYVCGKEWYAVNPYSIKSYQTAWGGIGDAYMELGRMKQCAHQYRAALDYAMLCKENYTQYKLDSPSSIAYALFDEGVCRYHIGLEEECSGNHENAITEWEASKSSLLKALDINSKMRAEFAFDTVDNQEYLGDVYVALHQDEEARKAYSMALAMLKKLVDGGDISIERIKQKLKCREM